MTTIPPGQRRSAPCLSDIMPSIQFIRPRTVVKLAIAAFVAFFLVTNIIDERKAEDGSALHLLRNEQKDGDQHNHVNVTASIISNGSFSDNEQKLPDDNKSDNHGDHHNNYSLAQNAVNNTSFRVEDGTEGNNHGDRNDNVNIPATMGYYNLSCPFEMYKYSCAAMQDNEFDEQVTASSMQYYQQHLSEIWRAFDSVFNVQINPQQKPKHIFMTGDSLLRQVFISIACNAFSLNAVEQSEVQWRKKWPCPEGRTKCTITGGIHSGFDAASVRFTNGMEIHFVPHSGFRVTGEGDVLQRMKRQVDDSGQIDFGTKTAFPPSGPMDVLVYELGAHRNPRKSREMLNRFASDIAMPLMRSKSEQRPKIVYVTTPTSHFNTTDGQYLLNGMNDEQKQCIDRVARNPRAELEKQILKAGVNVDVLLDYDDLELGALHVHKGDCLHYCMPGAVDFVGARLLETFSDTEQKIEDFDKSDNHGDHQNDTSFSGTEQRVEDGNKSEIEDGGDDNSNGDHNDNVNIPATMGYYNLSCPFEMYKYSCAAMQDSDTAASMQYYQQHLAEIWRAFDSVFNDQINPQQTPKHIFMTGDSLLRQVFISIACNAFSLNAVERSEVQWRKKWPCPEGIAKCAITGGVHSGFDAASVRFTNGIEIHYVPHRGFAYGNRSRGEPDVLQRMKRQVDDSGQIDFGTKTAFPPSGPMDVLVYELGAHHNPRKSREMLNRFASDIAMPLMRSKSEQRPKIVYVTTPTSHFNTTDGQYLSGNMGDEQKQCVDRVARNPRAELEKQILKAGVNVDVLLDYDDLELGALHVHKGDCLHYCMPGAVDFVGAQLLESF